MKKYKDYEAFLLDNIGAIYWALCSTTIFDAQGKARTIFKMPSKKQREEIFTRGIEVARGENPGESLSILKSDVSCAMRDFEMYRKMSYTKD